MSVIFYEIFVNLVGSYIQSVYIRLAYRLNTDVQYFQTSTALFDCLLHLSEPWPVDV